jgi:hypothetical protein
MKTNLHKLACDLAKLDGKTKKTGYDESVIGAETTLATLGRYLRTLKPAQALAVVAAIAEKGGK